MKTQLESSAQTIKSYRSSPTNNKILSPFKNQHILRPSHKIPCTICSVHSIRGMYIESVIPIRQGKSTRMLPAYSFCTVLDLDTQASVISQSSIQQDIELGNRRRINTSIFFHSTFVRHNNSIHTSLYLFKQVKTCPPGFSMLISFSAQASKASASKQATLEHITIRGNIASDVLTNTLCALTNLNSVGSGSRCSVVLIQCNHKGIYP